MSNKDALSAARLLLTAMYQESAPTRLKSAFIFGPVGAPVHARHLGAEVHFEETCLLKAVLFLRKHAAPHLRGLSVSELETQLRNFASEHFALLAVRGFLPRFSHSFSQEFSDTELEPFVAAMEASALFIEPRSLHLFPLSVVDVRTAFRSTAFFLLPPAELPPELATWYDADELAPASFPPIPMHAGMPLKPVASWLGVWAPTKSTARQRRAAVLGALALLPHPLERYLFTGRSLVTGYCAFERGWSVMSSNAHTPALSQDIILAQADHPWFSILAKKLLSNVTDDRKHVRALEYYYRAWMPDPVQRFPTLFAALDAIFGDAGQATQAVIAAASPIMGAEYTYERVKLLLSLRASVIHGGAPNVYESSSYQKYYEQYGKDAVRDLELIVARCLQTVIFFGALGERPHTHAALIRQKTGRVL